MTLRELGDHTSDGFDSVGRVIFDTELSDIALFFGWLFLIAIAVASVLALFGWLETRFGSGGHK